MEFNLSDIITTQEDPEEIFQLLEKLGTFIKIYFRTGKLRKCL